jgi:methionyl-tRNA formyltransferase
MSLRVALIGCVESSKVALETLLHLAAVRPVTLAAVITRKASTFNADFTDIAPLARQAGAQVYFTEDAGSADDQSQWLESLDLDVIFCVGWSNLLNTRTLKAARRGVVGFHPAALPANRGRHPLVWALALGLTETASTFFLMDEGTDSGPILSQTMLHIDEQDDAATLYAKVLAVMPGQITDMVNGMIDNTLTATPQDHSRASHWRKRSAQDGQIDWRMAASTIHNLVRALARPYPGAHAMVNNRSWRWKTRASL